VKKITSQFLVLHDHRHIEFTFELQMLNEFVRGHKLGELNEACEAVSQNSHSQGLAIPRRSAHP
jgi:hypothetical protein